jgi:hypothetical protein
MCCVATDESQRPDRRVIHLALRWVLDRSPNALRSRLWHALTHWFRATVRNATAGTTVPSVRWCRARNQVPMFPTAGSAAIVPVSSSRQPKVRSARAPDRHSRSRSVDAGIRARSVAIMCAGRPGQSRDRHGAGRDGNIRRCAATYCAAVLLPRLASIWPMASTTASNVSSVEAWRAL